MSPWKKGILAAFVSPVLMMVAALLGYVPTLEWLGMAIGYPGAWVGLKVVGPGHGMAQVAGALLGAYLWCGGIAYGIVHWVTRRRGMEDES